MADESDVVNIKINDVMDGDSFDVNLALSHLLYLSVVQINSAEFYSLKLVVSCDDVFHQGCVDAQEIATSDIELLYRLWVYSPHFGAIIWASRHGGRKPNKTILAKLDKEQIDLDDLMNKDDEALHDFLCTKL